MRTVGFFGVAIAMAAWLGADMAWADAGAVEVSVKGTLPFGRLDFTDRVKAGDKARGGGAMVRVSLVGELNGAVTITVGALRREMQFERRPRTRQERVAEAQKMAEVVLQMIARARAQMARAKAAAEAAAKAKAPPPPPPSATPGTPDKAATGGSRFEIKAEGFLSFSRPDFRESVLNALPAADRPSLRVYVHGATNGAVTVKVGELRRVLTVERRQRSRPERVTEARKMARIVLDMIAQLKRMWEQKRRLAAQRRARYRAAPEGAAAKGGSSSRAFSLSIQGLFPFSRPDLREQLMAALPPAGHRPRVTIEIKGGYGGKVYVRVEGQHHRTTFERRHRSRRERVAEAKKMANVVLGMIAKATGTTVSRLRAEAKRLREPKKASPPASAPVKAPEQAPTESPPPPEKKGTGY